MNSVNHSLDEFLQKPGKHRKQRNKKKTEKTKETTGRMLRNEGESYGFLYFLFSDSKEMANKKGNQTIP